MKYGCIGEHLSHSFSKEIHNRLADYEYEIREVAREELCEFLSTRDFLGINVTIPYKELVIPHLEYIDESASRIGAVNTVVNRDGTLCGYNTDFYGMSALICHSGITIEGSCVAILGTGGTAKTTREVCESLGAREVILVSRMASEVAIDYSTLSKIGEKIDVIINTTPVGMYPNIEGAPVSLEDFPRLSGVIDSIYNPLRSELVCKAMERGIAAVGGLYMLVAQAVRASEIFLDTTYPEGVLERVYRSVLASKENIVLIGMPASGKSTVAAIVAEALSRELVDTDEVIIASEGVEITDIFKKLGEEAFRNMETSALRELSKRTSLVIATGGGAILRDENVRALRKNGRLFFLDRPPEKLIPTESRPLSSDREAITARYNERYSRYLAVADERIDADAEPSAIANLIGEGYK